jgi:hypothetical protein
MPLPLPIVAVIGVGAALAVSFCYPLFIKVAQLGWERSNRKELEAMQKAARSIAIH